MGYNKQSMIDKLGSEEAYLDFMRQIGSKGGKRKVPKGKYHKAKR